MPFPRRGRRPILLVALGGTAFLLSCAPKPPALLQGSYPGGSPRYHVETDSLGRKHGLERWWHENGTLKSEATWRAGVRDGDYRAWYPDGTPWYAGRDSMGHPSDTLRFWHPNGRLRSLSVFAAGAPAWLEEYDTLGLTAEEARRRAAEAEARAAAARRTDSLAALAASRARALEEWSALARTSVEAWWKLPEPMLKVPRRAAARLRVARDGALLGVAWTEKSGSREFDARAARALAKMKKFPPLPPEVAAPLDMAYAFTTPGLPPPRRKLQVRKPDEVAQQEGNGATEQRDNGTMKGWE